jgi:quercetin dioxygenase-like cupin family protein
MGIDTPSASRIVTIRAKPEPLAIDTASEVPMWVRGVVGALTAALTLGLGGCMARSAQQPTLPERMAKRPASPLILQAPEGERRVRRNVNFPFIIKVDRLNGGAPDLVVGSEDIPPGQGIPPHRHVIADEIVFVHRGTGLATVGALEKPVTEGATIYIPRDTLVTLRNTGSDPMTIVFVFSKPGFEEYLRDTSVREGETATAMSSEERARVLEKHEWHTVYERTQR